MCDASYVLTYVQKLTIAVNLLNQTLIRRHDAASGTLSSNVRLGTIKYMRH